MNTREKTLILILFGVAFVIINAFVFTSYQATMQKKRIQLQKGARELEQMEKDLAMWASRAEEVEWLSNHQPAEGVHGTVGAQLVKDTEEAALRHGVTLPQRPGPQKAEPDETGVYQSARVKVLANAMDGQLYNWLTDLQDPAKSRSITFLRISPQRDDATRVDCELEITQWFLPEMEEAGVVTE